MPKRLSQAILITALFVQIAFSFLYSSQIIDQNQRLNSQQLILKQLQLDNQRLEKKLSRLSSLQFLQNQLHQKTLVPIYKNLKLLP